MGRRYASSSVQTLACPWGGANYEIRSARPHRNRVGIPGWGHGHKCSVGLTKPTATKVPFLGRFHDLLLDDGLFDCHGSASAKGTELLSQLRTWV